MKYTIIVTTTVFISFFIVAYFFQKMNFISKITTSSIGERYYFLDGLRGICAIFVVIGHSWRLGIKGFYFDNYIINSASFMASVAVQVFFCITSFLFINQIIKKDFRVDWVKFFTSRIKRLSPLFFISATTILIIIYIINFSKLNEISLKDIESSFKLYLFGFYGDQEIFGYSSRITSVMTWTLPYEWKFYVMLPLFCGFLNTFNFKNPIFFLLSFFFLTLFFFEANIGKYFFIGALSSVFFNLYELKNKATKKILILLSFIFIISVFFVSNDAYSNIIFIFVLLFFLTFTMLKPKFFEKEIFVSLGDISYSIYLLHIPIIIIISYISYFMFGDVKVNIYNSILIFSTSSILICAISFLSYKNIELRFMRNSMR